MMMKRLANFIISEELNIIAENLVISEEIINEGFKSSIIDGIAHKILKYEKKHRDTDRERNEEGDHSTKSAKSFASIFGPVEIGNKYDKKKAQGLKWSEITNDDLKKYSGSDKELIKLIKQTYQHKLKADFIVCDPGTEECIYFIKGYNENKDIIVYQFNDPNKWNGGFNPKVEKAYKYQDRNLKAEEAINLIKDYDVYALVITDDMLKEYNTLFLDRENSKKGMINYDKQSLANLLKKQQMKYKALAEEMRAKKLINNKEALWDEITKTNQEVIDFYKKLIDNPDYIDKRYNLGDLMQYVNYAFESYYKFVKNWRAADRRVERAKEQGREEPEKYGEYERSTAKNEINDAKEYIQRIHKEMKNIQKQLEEIEEE